MESYCDTSRINLKIINKKVAKDIIIKNHYTHTWSLCKVAYGIYYKEDINNDFFDDLNEKLIGCIVYSNPVGRCASSSLSDKLNDDEVFELIRLFIFDGYGKNIESFCISQSFKKLNEDFPKIKAILSYADGEQGHCGTIYQATGFLYQGSGNIIKMPNYSISLKGPPNYEWIHSRTVSSRWGSVNLDKLKKSIGKSFWRKKESFKHRYVKFISNNRDNKILKKSLKHPILPYPKDDLFESEIEEIKIENTSELSFF